MSDAELHSLLVSMPVRFIDVDLLLTSTPLPPRSWRDQMAVLVAETSAELERLIAERKSRYQPAPQNGRHHGGGKGR